MRYAMRPAAAGAALLMSLAMVPQAAHARPPAEASAVATHVSAPQPPKVGGRCSRAGATAVGSDGKKLVCKRVKRKLVWTLAPTPPAPKTPTFSVAPFELSQLDCTVTAPSPIPTSCFRPFAFSFTKEDGSIKVLPHYTYMVKPGTDVFASVDADMVKVEYQPDSNDYEVLLIVFTSDRNAFWKIAVDHLDEVAVQSGGPIKAGTKIGVVTSTHDVEFQVNQIKDQYGQGNLYVCPKTLGGPAFNAFHAEALRQSNAAFPQYAASSECLEQSIPITD